MSPAAVSPDRATLAAFAALTAVGGLNVVAVRVGSAELPPFTGGAARLGLAAIIFLALIPIARAPLPRGRALAGVAMYGVLGLGLAYALAYYAIAQLPAAVAALVMALVPLLTVAFAAVHRVEPLQARTIVGGILAVAGVAAVLAQGFAGSGSGVALLAMLGAGAAAAESSVLMKRFPRAHPVAMNAVAMLIGAALLIAGMLLTGERPALPVRSETWLAFGYVVVIGTVALFSLYLFTLRRWTASATAYAFVLMPFVAVPAAALLAGETVGLSFLAGLGLVLAGVYVGALAPAHASPVPGVPAAAVRTAQLCAEQTPFPKCI